MPATGLAAWGLLEPSGIEPSVRARRSALSRGGHGLHRPFFRRKDAQNGLFQPDPPLRQASVSVVSAKIVVLAETPTANAAPWLSITSFWKPGYPRCRFASLPASRRYAWPERCLTLSRWSVPVPRGSALASLTRWQSASTTPPRAAAGFSWTSPAASFFVVAPAALICMVSIPGV